VSADTLRHYERRGLLPPPARLANRYRVYPAATLERVLLIQRALAVGFTLDELSRLLRARDAGHAPCAEVRTLAERKLREVDGQLENLASFRSALEGILRDWDLRLRDVRKGQPARLLESLPAAPVRPSPLRAVAFEHRGSKRKDRK
jgi:MerR family transcriptional regulator, Zn(II)-responsive regulator of zntA